MYQAGHGLAQAFFIDFKDRPPAFDSLAPTTVVQGSLLNISVTGSSFTQQTQVRLFSDSAQIFSLQIYFVNESHLIVLF